MLTPGTGCAGAERVVVVQTGTANLASVLAGLRRAGAEPTLSSDRDEVAAAERLVLPGVGAFAAAMRRLVENDLVDVLVRRVHAGRPTLAICLGLQILCESSDESPGAVGLGIWRARVRRFPTGLRVPQLGWNEIVPEAGCTYLRRGFAYFANSYRLTECPTGWNAAFADHGGPFVAALERGAVLACQFHPELSGSWGLELIARWLATAGNPRLDRLATAGAKPDRCAEGQPC